MWSSPYGNRQYQARLRNASLEWVPCKYSQHNGVNGHLRSTLSPKEWGSISISVLHVQYFNGTCVRISPSSSATRETGIEETACRFALDRLWMYQISRSDMQLQMQTR